MNLPIPLRRFFSPPLDLFIGIYIYSFLSLTLKAWFDIDTALNIRVADLRNPIIFFVVAALARFALGRRWKDGVWADLTRKALSIVIGVYAVIIAYYLIWGGIAFSAPVTAPHPLLWNYQLFLAACLLRFALWWMENRGAPSEITSKPSLLTQSHYAVVAVIFLCAFLLRLWGMGQGVADDFLHPDAYKQVEAAQQYINSNYSFDLEYKDEYHTGGYPYFSMHAPALLAEALRHVADFAGFDSHIDYPFLVKVCRTMSLAYSMLILIILFVLGVRHFGFGAGTLASLLLSLTLLQIHCAKFIGADLPMSMYALVALYFACGNLIEEKKRNYLLAGVFAGLAACSKYNGSLTVIFIAAIYLAKRDGLKDTIRSASLPALSALAMAITVMLVTPNIWSDPVEGLKAIRNAMHYSSTYAMDETTGKPGLFGEMLGYNLWTLEGLITPMHWIPALAGYAAAFVFSPKKWWALFLSPVLIFIIGKYGMPMSAPAHFTLIQPLIILVISAGYSEMWRRNKLARVALTGVAVLYIPSLAYRAVDDTSMWTIRQTTPTAVEWINQNVEIDRSHWESRPNTVTGSIKFNEKLDPGAALADFRFREPPPPTLQRNQRNIVWRPEGVAFFPPQSHFSTDAEVSVIFGGVTDIVTTEKYFSLGKDDIFTKERLITDDIKDKEIYLHIKNGSAENSITCAVAGTTVKVNLKPYMKWTGAFELVSKTRLYYGQFYSVKCAAKKHSAVAIAINDLEKGALLQSEGKINDAKKTYMRSQNMAGRLLALKLADSQREASSIADGIAVLNTISGVLDIGKDGINVSGSALKGDMLFDGKMTQPILNVSNDSVKRTNFAWEIGPGGMIYGPYIPLMAGEYVAQARYYSDSADVQFVMDVVSDYGNKTLARKTIMHEGAGVHVVTLPFTVLDYLEYPIEVRIHDVKDGKISFLGASIKNDYKKRRDDLILAVFNNFSALKTEAESAGKSGRVGALKDRDKQSGK